MHEVFKAVLAAQGVLLYAEGSNPDVVLVVGYANGSWFSSFYSIMDENFFDLVECQNVVEAIDVHDRRCEREQDISLLRG